jgi:hypothetical protein
MPTSPRLLTDIAPPLKICLSYVYYTSFVHNKLLMKFNFEPPAIEQIVEKIHLLVWISVAGGTKGLRCASGAYIDLCCLAPLHDVPLLSVQSNLLCG